jgi:sigma-B regulation protein RsbU (phosphoserine phosphatase)
MQKNILIIDDEAHIRKMLNKVLSRAGYKVFEAGDGEEALELLDEISADLIILDMNMPRMDGITFLKHYERHRTYAPVLMMSGSDDVQQRIECYRLGVYDFISKPEENEVILKRIENGLKIGEMIDFNESIKIELFMAKKLQKYLFPESSLSTKTVDVDIYSRPYADIGGDLYDYILFRDGEIIFFVADVSGHSISASLFIAIVKMIFRNAIKVTTDPRRIMEIMNTELSENLPMESFVTMFCGLLGADGKKLVYANAGHPCPYVLSDRGGERLEGNDSFLGPIKNAEFESYEKELKTGETLFIYTDGLVDSLEQNDPEEGKQFFLDVLTHEGSDGKKKFEQLKEKFSHENMQIMDDCTLMMVSIK